MEIFRTYIFFEAFFIADRQSNGSIQNVIMDKNMMAENEYFIAMYGDKLSQALIPYKGKHAVKTSDFFKIVRANQCNALPDSWFYRPLKVEVELTNGCNISCPHCGMSSKPVGNRDVLPDHILHRIPFELEKLGIPGISITGGEVFTVFHKLLSFIDRCRGVVDIVKLTTNAFWAETYNSAKKYLHQLKDAGLVDTRLFRPVLLISIGEQNVPLMNVVNALVAARDIFSETELALCISSLSERYGENKLKQLELYYRDITGRSFPWSQIFLTSRTYILAGRALNDPTFPQRKVPIQKMCKERGCFFQTVGAFVVPTPLIKANGDAYSCAVFGMPDKLKLGNVFRDSVFKLIEAANNNKYIKIITDGGLPLLQRYTPEIHLRDAFADNFHEACWHMISHFQDENIQETDIGES